MVQVTRYVDILALLTILDAFDVLGEAELGLGLHGLKVFRQADIGEHQVGFIQHNELAWVHIGRFEVDERFPEIQLVNEPDPATVEEELVGLLGELRVTLVDLEHEYLLRLLYFSHVQQAVNLQLSRNLLQLRYLSLNAIFHVRLLVVRNQQDVARDIVEGRVTVLELVHEWPLLLE